MKTFLALSWLMLSACSGWAEAGWFAAPALEQAPELSRGLDDPAWAKALKVAFTKRDDLPGDTQKYPTEVYWLRAGGSLFVGFKCLNPASPNLWVLPKQLRDSTIYRKESVELFLGNATGELFYQFIVDAEGNIFDGKLGSPRWDGDWKSKTDRRDGNWTAVIEIPAPLLATVWSTGSFVTMDATRHAFNTDGTGAETTSIVSNGLRSPENKVFLGTINPAALGKTIERGIADFRENFKGVPLPESVAARIPKIEAFAAECQHAGDMTLERYRQFYADFLHTGREIRGLEQELVLNVTVKESHP